VTALPPVPMLDLSVQHRLVEDRILTGFEAAMRNSDFILGAAVTQFEEQFARYCKVSHAVGVGNGTDALELALRGAGVEPGDEVIAPANTFVATVEAILRAGATPVFADCDENFLLDAESVLEHRTERTRAVIAVHLYGQTAAVERIRAAAGEQVLLIEDAAQAQGATRFGRPAGSLGDAAGTSFYPGKNLGAYGDAGAVMTGTDAIAHRVRRLRNHGGVRKYEHAEVGTNSRLDTLQAIVLLAKLEYLDRWNAERRRIADRYTALLAEQGGIVTPVTLPGNEHVFHQYVVRVPDRDRVLAELNAQGIGAGLHYPTPVHLLVPYAAGRHPRGSLPVAEESAGQILSLPIYPGLRDDQVERVAERLISAVQSASVEAAGRSGA
jgi:dTDP-4-amino-4,6-dideoxygalactose transaminase